MQWVILCLGFGLGLAIGLLRESTSKRDNNTTRRLTGGSRYTVPPPTMYIQRLPHLELERLWRQVWEASWLERSSRHVWTIAEEGSHILQGWRSSIVGLVRLADRNLTVARKHLEASNYRLAIQAASTSIENISRALIHCFGDKPNQDPGQEEVLRILSTRFNGDEKAEFDRSIEMIAKINHNRIASRYLSSQNVRLTPFNRAQTNLVIESASNILSRFRQILIQHFSDEIPELNGCM